MKAALFLEPGAPLSLEAVELLPLRANDVRVRITATSLCHTDVAIRSGEQTYGTPIVMGHEACGVVEAVGAAVQGIQVDDRVISSTAPSCGHCENCTGGRPPVCVLCGRPRRQPPARPPQG